MFSDIKRKMFQKVSYIKRDVVTLAIFCLAFMKLYWWGLVVTDFEPGVKQIINPLEK